MRHAAVFLVAAAAGLAATAPPEEKPEPDRPWKVDEAHGPTTTVAFTTDEGTWIHLDVHPDGRRIVFSLLGDLYLLPIDGGEARRITSGPAYDVQPRFSPDGAGIAFASDRGGIENLWVCDLEGKNARAVTSEKDTTVTGPAWSPDGEYLLGRKRLTDQSSLGTVEIWMWHLKGGEGIQITKREDQPDAADMAFSPDGRFVYFSARDSRYRYNRDVYEGIWQIKRFDRRTGQVVPVTGESGGGAAPRISPDGKSLAFVRRARAQTRLAVMDLATGRTRLVGEGMERDLMEGFAFHGTFPAYAWTPDSRAIVATAGGRIWRYDAGSGARAAIPFTAPVEQTVAEALRFPRRLGAATVRARILRWPVESPDGRRLVFSAAGHLYTMDLPSGRPRRLTDLDDLEYAPAFSRDGASLVFVTWNDARGGHVWTLDAGAGASARPRRLTEVPAQYANPSFSPDGRRIVYLKGSGATFRDQDLADELWFEIHVMDAAGGPGRYVIGTKNRGQNRRMPRPAFSRDGERIFYVEDEPSGKPSEPPKTLLVSVKLDGTDRQAHLKWTRAEEAVVSPDGRWVIFSESHNAWVAPLPEAGRQTVEVKLESGALPVAQLTDEGGEWVNWADGGRTLTWIFGPVYRRLALEKAFPPPEPGAEAKAGEAGKDGGDGGGKKPRKKELPKPDAFEITLELPRARPSGTTAFKGARIVTMKGEEVIAGGAIVVEGDRIAAVGPEGRVLIPSGAKVIDVAGATIVPGLFDEHAHLHYSTLDVTPQRPWKYLANLAYGVTTTHDPSAATHEVFAQSEMVEAGLMTGPRIFSTGFILYGADNPGRAVIKSLDDARHHVRRLKTLGAFTVKSYMQPRREQRQWILEAAREEEVMVVPEGGGDLETDMTMVLDGHTTIEHALPVAPLRKDVLTLMSRSGTAYTPTLLVAYGGLAGDQWYFQHYDVFKDAGLLRFVPEGVIDPVARIRGVMAPDEEWHHIDVAAAARDLARAGGRVCLGAHGQMQGIGPHWEMWSFVQGGMTPHEALRTATLAGAQALGLDGDLGSIEPGKLADFVVLEKDPLERIQNSDSVRLVVKNGFVFRPEDLARTK
jgi:Tol biopolymer transport system component/imidazolonepropionase-like amidohydrolase